MTIRTVIVMGRRQARGRSFALVTPEKLSARAWQSEGRVGRETGAIGQVQSRGGGGVAGRTGAGVVE